MAQQCLQAGLVDEVGMDLVPVLLGEGVRFFERLGTDRIGLWTNAVRELDRGNLAP